MTPKGPPLTHSVLSAGSHVQFVSTAWPRWLIICSSLPFSLCIAFVTECSPVSISHSSHTHFTGLCLSLHPPTPPAHFWHSTWIQQVPASQPKLPRMSGLFSPTGFLRPRCVWKEGVPLYFPQVPHI